MPWMKNAMRQAIWNDAQEIIGFKLNQKISRRHLEFTANIVLVTEEMEQMQDFLDYAEHNVQKLACTWMLTKQISWVLIKSKRQF